jgi:hypothetical protein
LIDEEHPCASHAGERFRLPAAQRRVGDLVAVLDRTRAPDRRASTRATRSSVSARSGVIAYSPRAAPRARRAARRQWRL